MKLVLESMKEEKREMQVSLHPFLQDRRKWLAQKNLPSKNCCGDTTAQLANRNFICLKVNLFFPVITASSVGKNLIEK